MTVYFPTTEVVRTTTEGNLSFYREVIVEYRDRTGLRRAMLHNPRHFWIRQDGSVTIQHAGPTLIGMRDFRLIGGLDHGGSLTDGALGERPDPAGHFMDTDEGIHVDGLRTKDIPQTRDYRIRLTVALYRGFYGSATGMLRQAKEDIDRLYGF